MTKLQTRLITTCDELQRLEAPWRQLHAESRGTIFQTYDWLMNWWTIYAQPGFSLRVFAVLDGERLVGLLPMFLEITGVPGIRMRRLRFLGVYEIYGEYSPLVSPGYEDNVIPLMAEFCLSNLYQKECSLVSFFRFSPDSKIMEHLLKEVKSRNPSIRYVPDCMARVMLTLPETWESYLNMLSPTEQEMLKRRTRSLFRKNVELEIITSPSDEAFEDFVRLHTATWRDKGIDGYFASSKRFEQFQRDITARLISTGNGRLYFFKKDGIRFAAVQAFFINDQCCFYLSGLDRHHELIRYSPGKVLLSLVIKDAIEGGYRSFDFQGGLEDYKFRLGGRRTSFSKTLIWNGGYLNLKVVGFLALSGGFQYFKTNILESIIIPSLRKLERQFNHRSNSRAGQSNLS